MPEAFANPIKDEITRHNWLLSWLRMQQSVGKILGIVFFCFLVYAGPRPRPRTQRV